MAATTVQVATTDPAYEFAGLAASILSHSSGKLIPLYDGLSNFVGIPSDNPLFFEIIGMIGSRALSLMDFIRGLNDEYLDEDLRSSLIAGIAEMTQIINPAQMHQQYNPAVAKFMPQQNIRLLRLFSRTARQYRPLRLVLPDEREKILTAISEALTELNEDKHFPDWAIAPLKDGLRRLALMINCFQVFGHDAVLDQLLKIQAETKSNFDFLQTMKVVSEHKLVKTIGVLSLVANILLLPPKASAAIPYYREHIHFLVQEVPKLLGGPLKQLTHQPTEGDGAMPSEEPLSSEPVLNGP